jgi:hypothetical protein
VPIEQTVPERELRAKGRILERLLKKADMKESARSSVHVNRL